MQSLAKVTQSDCRADLLEGPGALWLRTKFCNDVRLLKFVPECSEHIEIDAMLTVYRLLRVRACVRVWCVFG